jgi:putative endonuclease
MFLVYALSSLNRNYIYVGMTSDPERRIDDHNKGYNKTTKAYSPFKTILFEEHETRIVARKREKYLKSGIGKEYLKELLRNMD